MAEGSEGLDDLLERMSWLIAAPARSEPADPSVQGPGMGMPPTRYAVSAAETAPETAPDPAWRPASHHASALAVDITAAAPTFNARRATVLPLNPDGEFDPFVLDCDGCMCPCGSPPCHHCVEHFTDDLYLICDADPPEWSPSFGRTDP